MKNRKTVALFVAFVFILGVGTASISLAGKAKVPEVHVTGAITAIAGNNVTIQDAAGALTTVAVKSVVGFKVGDLVHVSKGNTLKLGPPDKAVKAP